MEGRLSNMMNLSFGDLLVVFTTYYGEAAHRVAEMRDFYKGYTEFLRFASLLNPL
jgi:hypothetical protein